MFCKFISQRTRNYIKYWYCRKNKISIELNACYSCKNFECKKLKTITKKSKKLKALEKSRYSILTEDMKHCYICGAKKKHIHEIFGGRNRQVSIRNGFCIPICDMCHNKTEEDMEFDKSLKRECQKKFEEDHTREEFLRLIDKSYLY